MGEQKHHVRSMISATLMIASHQQAQAQDIESLAEAAEILAALTTQGESDASNSFSAHPPADSTEVHPNSTDAPNPMGATAQTVPLSTPIVNLVMANGPASATALGHTANGPEHSASFINTSGSLSSTGRCQLDPGLNDGAPLLEHTTPQLLDEEQTETPLSRALDQSSSSQSEGGLLSLDNPSIQALETQNTCSALDKEATPLQDSSQLASQNPTHTPPEQSNSGHSATTQSQPGHGQTTHQFTTTSAAEDEVNFVIDDDSAVNNGDSDDDTSSPSGPVNLAPVVQDLVFNIDASDISSGVLLTATDPEGDNFTFAKHVPTNFTTSYDPSFVSSHGLVTINQSEFSDGADFIALDEGETITIYGRYEATDEHGAQSTPANYTIIVHGESEAPETQDHKATINKTDLFHIKTFFEPDAPTYNLDVTTLVTDVNNDDTFSVDIDTGDISFSVWDGNSFVKTAATVTFDANTQTFEVSASDPKLNEFSFSFDNGVIEIHYGQLNHLSVDDKIQLNIEYTATDDFGDSSTGDISININGGNIAPFLENEKMIVSEGEIIGHDTTGSVIFTPPQALNATVNIAANDADQVLYNSQVYEFDDFVEFFDDIYFAAFKFDPDTSFLANAVDADGDPLTVLGYYFDIGNGTFQYVSDADEDATIYLLEGQAASITYYVTDAQGQLLADQEAAFDNLLNGLTSNVSGTYSTNTLISLGALPGSEHISSSTLHYQANIHFNTVPIGTSGSDPDVLFDVANTLYESVEDGSQNSGGGVTLSSLF